MGLSPTRNHKVSLALFVHKGQCVLHLLFEFSINILLGFIIWTAYTETFKYLIFLSIALISLNISLSI